MDKITSPQIIEDIKTLISHSICEGRKKCDYTGMHKAILKQYFDARKVKLNYRENTVDIQLPVGRKQYTKITFECQDLERFLRSCLRKDEKSLFLYQSLLSQYNVISAA